MSTPSTAMTEQEWPYPSIPPRESGILALSGSAHRMYWEEYGNPAGEPVMVLHGGPGGASSSFMARYFDPSRYRILLFDQRGCGRSTPCVASDPAGGLAANTTGDLIGDIKALRAHRGIEEKMHVFGGSWGSTLALAYAIAHPETVETLVLRGVFLCRRQDLDFFYQGNAKAYAQNPFDGSSPGAYLHYPEAWKLFVETIPPENRHDMVAAYAEIFKTVPATPQESRRLDEAALAWSVWEGVTSYLAQDMSDLGKFAEPDFAKAFALIENHYFMNGAFLGGQAGPSHRDNNYLLENAYRLKDIPVHIVHGRFDVVCPMLQADALVSALVAGGNERVTLHRTVAGHSMQERENARALIEIMTHLPPQVDRAPRGQETGRGVPTQGVFQVPQASP